jgi:dipeptidyl aminopeptidase/acylaminoacyl peptidase
MAADMFENVKKMGKIKCPIFIMHGAADEVIPVFHAKVTRNQL